MRIAILGAGSRLARDYVVSSVARGDPPEFRLLARRPEAVREFLAENGLSGRFEVGGIADLATGDHDAVMNFVGVGDPARARAMGREILRTTADVDRLVLDHLARRPETRYIFLSSGAVYGGRFEAPATETTPAETPINDIQPRDLYGAAKLHAEVTHRAHPEFSIIDARIFNYISRTIDPAARFLIMDMIAAARSGSVFRTDDREIVRDYLHPDDFRGLMDACLAAPAGTNRSVDAYSRAPITKSELVALMAREFGMRHEITPTIDAIDATGVKPRYHSLNRRAAELGYHPVHSSESGIVTEVRAMTAAG